MPKYAVEVRLAVTRRVIIDTGKETIDDNTNYEVLKHLSIGKCIEEANTKEYTQVNPLGFHIIGQKKE